MTNPTEAVRRILDGYAMDAAEVPEVSASAFILNRSDTIARHISAALATTQLPESDVAGWHQSYWQIERRCSPSQYSSDGTPFFVSDPMHARRFSTKAEAMAAFRRWHANDRADCFVSEHMDSDAVTPESDVKAGVGGKLREAAQDLLDRMSGTYKARNGRVMGIEGDDGEKCWIVHSDEITALEAALLPMPMLVSQEWLDRGVSTDPDIECEAGPSGTAWLDIPHSQIAAIHAEAFEKAARVAEGAAAGDKKMEQHYLASAAAADSTSGRDVDLEYAVSSARRSSGASAIARDIRALMVESVCAAQRQGSAGGNDPVDCNWPMCGCDPHADRVIASLVEQGLLVQ